MTNDGFMTACAMKKQLGLKSKKKDYRTLNRYVIEGKLEIKSLSRKVKLYRFPLTAPKTNQDQIDLDFCF